MAGLTLGFGLGEVVARVWWWAHPVEIHEYSLDNPNYALTRTVAGLQEYEFVPSSEQYDLKINALGFRDREYEKEPQGDFRALVVGDSIVQGDSASDAVPLEEIFANVMEDSLNRASVERRYEFISTGVAGYNLVQEVAFLENRGLDLDPDLIVIGTCLNDFAPPQMVRRSGDVWQIRFYSEVFPDILPLGPLELPLLQHLFVTRYLVRGLHRLGMDGNGELIDLDAARSHRALDKLKAISEQVPVVVAVFPYLLEELTTAENSLEHRLAVDSFRRAGFPTLELVEEFMPFSSEQLKADPEDHVHPGPLGHRLAARAVLRWLGELELVPDASAAAHLLEDSSSEETRDP